MLTDRQARIPAGGGAGGLPEEHRKVSCSLFPRPPHGRGRHSDRP